MSRSGRAYAMLALAMLFWAGNGIVGRAVRDDIPPATLSLLRWFGALALLLPSAWRHFVADRALLAAGWRRVIALGLIGVASFNTLYYLGLHDTTASNGLLLQALIPAFVLVADRALFGIRAPMTIVAGVAVATLGVAVIVFRGDPAMVATLALGRGDVLILIAVVCWAIYTSLLRTRPAVHPLAFLAAIFAVGIVALLPVAAFEFVRGGVIHWSWGSVAAIAYVAVFPSLLAYLLFNRSVAEIGSARAGQAINLMPLFGALLAAALLGEHLHGYHAIGMAMILAGLVIGLAMTRQPDTGQSVTSP